MKKLLNLETWRSLVRQLKRELIVLNLVARDRRVSWYARALVIGIVAYAISPIDLIPDFIPIIGYLDDLLILPLAIWLALKLIPAEVMQDCRSQAERLMSESGTALKQAQWQGWLVTSLIVLLWLGIFVGAIKLLYTWIRP